jgi:Integrase core domain
MLGPRRHALCQFQRVGPRTIEHRLGVEGLVPVSGRTSIYRCLVRHGLMTPEACKRKRADYKRWERGRAMELWQMDVVDDVRLVDSSELKVTTGVDDHSRFCVSAYVVARATARPTCDALALAMRSHGVPAQILTDNGKVFTGRFGTTTGRSCSTASAGKRDPAPVDREGAASRRCDSGRRGGRQRGNGHQVEISSLAEACDHLADTAAAAQWVTDSLAVPGSAVRPDAATLHWLSVEEGPRDGEAVKAADDGAQPRRARHHQIAERARRLRRRRIDFCLGAHPLRDQTRCCARSSPG